MGSLRTRNNPKHFGAVMADVVRCHGLMKPTDTLTLHFDGACEPRNPGGVATGGWRIVADDGTIFSEGSEAFCEGLGATNNIAEYRALQAALAWIADRLLFFCGLGIMQLHVCGDSLLVVNQINGDWKCRKPHLADLRDRCRQLLEQIQTEGIECRVSWIPRSQNAEADALSQRAYETHTGESFPVTR